MLYAKAGRRRLPTRSMKSGGQAANTAIAERFVKARPGNDGDSPPTEKRAGDFFSVRN